MKIAIYLIGSLGDTLAALPALWALKRHYGKDRLVLLTDRQVDHRVGPREILEGSGLLDETVEYPSYECSGPSFTKALGFLRLYGICRTLAPDKLVYLVRGTHDQPRISRDLTFFRLAGIRDIIGVEGMPEHGPGKTVPLPRLSSQADQFLGRLSAAGIPVPPPGQGRCDLGLHESDHLAFQRWADTLPGDGGRRWVAFAPGSKMPSKIWPEARYAEVGQRLIESHDIWPVIFGGGEDAAAGRRLIDGWGRGYLAAGALGIRAAAVGLTRCSLYVGNDTGTMHLAATSGVRCVAIFSSRDFPGLWDPYGIGHVVFRSDPPCAGCFSIDCAKGDYRCLLAITVEPVTAAARRILDDVAAVV